MQLGNQSQVPAKLLIRELFRWSWSKSERNPIVLGVDTIPVSGRSAFPWGKPTRGSSPSSLPRYPDIRPFWFFVYSAVDDFVTVKSLSATNWTSRRRAGLQVWR